jgi:hypothetical protein
VLRKVSRERLFGYANRAPNLHADHVRDHPVGCALRDLEALGHLIDGQKRHFLALLWSTSAGGTPRAIDSARRQASEHTTHSGSPPSSLPNHAQPGPQTLAPPQCEHRHSRGIYTALPTHHSRPFRSAYWTSVAINRSGDERVAWIARCSSTERDSRRDRSQPHVQ